MHAIPRAKPDSSAGRPAIAGVGISHPDRVISHASGLHEALERVGTRSAAASTDPGERKDPWAEYWTTKQRS